MGKGKVLKIYDTKAVFESLDTGSCILITQNNSTNNTNTITKEIQLTTKHFLPDLIGICQIINFEVIYGFYELISGPYVALVIESEPFVTIGPVIIRKAKKFLVIPLFHDNKLYVDSKKQDEDKYLELLQLGFQSHNFFYSYTFDLTLSQQEISSLSNTELSNPLYTRADDRFFWNKDVLSDLISISADEWIIPFLSGYIEFKHECIIENEKFAFLFISRRSRYRQGCRFTKRGIDSNGNVANFVETEQILIFPDSTVFSYVQIRGSIPLYWKSPVTMKYEPKVYIDPNVKLSVDAADKHFHSLVNKYSNNVLIMNLIDMKKDQLKLGSLYKDVIDQLHQKNLINISTNTVSSVIPNLHYYWFDFHHEVKKKGKWNNLVNIFDLPNINEILTNQSYFCRLSSTEVISKQNGVIRTNCMDNLDRTNVIQSIFGRRIILIQLSDYIQMKYNKPTMLYNKIDSKADGKIDNSMYYNSKYAQFEKIYKYVWSNNANSISLGYAGTNALKVDFTRTGKRTIKGMINDGINSVQRYYINNFLDGNKQDAIDILLGNYVINKSNDYKSPFNQSNNVDEENVTNYFIKSFVLCIIIFLSLLIILPNQIKYADRTVEDRYIDSLGLHLLISLSITSVIVIIILYTIVKKGSKLGEKLVKTPKLLPDI